MYKLSTGSGGSGSKLYNSLLILFMIKIQTL